MVAVFAVLPSVRTSVRPKAEYTIVIDPGHGGLDVK